MSNQDILAAPCVVQKTKMAYLKVQNSSPQTIGGHHGGFSFAFSINATVYLKLAYSYFTSAGLKQKHNDTSIISK